MFYVRLAGGHLYGKQLFTWLSLVVSFMASFVLSFFPLDVLDGIWDLIESVSEGFLTYSVRQATVIAICNPIRMSEFLSNVLWDICGNQNFPKSVLGARHILDSAISFVRWIKKPLQISNTYDTV